MMMMSFAAILKNVAHAWTLYQRGSCRFQAWAVGIYFIRECTKYRVTGITFSIQELPSEKRGHPQKETRHCDGWVRILFRDFRGQLLSTLSKIKKWIMNNEKWIMEDLLIQIPQFLIINF
jgi:hypothetical protein